MTKSKIPKIQISKEDAESFTAGLGQITGGSYKLILLADKQGVPKALGYEDVRDWVNDRLGGYVRHPIEERTKIVAELVANGEKKVEIAKALGVNASTVFEDKRRIDGKPTRHAVAAKKKSSQIREPEDKPAAKKEDNYVPAKPKPVDPDQLAEEGLELLVWNKIKDRFLPFWNGILESLDDDEAEIASYVVWQHAPTKP